MKIELHNQWIQIRVTTHSDFDLLEKELVSSFEYKQHRFIHLIYEDSIFSQTFLKFVSKLKKLPIFLIYEGWLPGDIKQIYLLYAAGVDAFFLLDKEENIQDDIKAELNALISTGKIFFNSLELTGGDAANFNKRIFQKLPFLSEDSFFEPIKRKVLIEISNLVRKLRVKEIDDSYNSAGL